jgi:hypothetical protein
MPIRESAGSMQAESSKLKAKKGIIPYIQNPLFPADFN